MFFAALPSKSCDYGCDTLSTSFSERISHVVSVRLMNVALNNDHDVSAYVFRKRIYLPYGRTRILKNFDFDFIEFNGKYRKFSWLVCFRTRFLTTAPAIGHIEPGCVIPGVDGVVSYSTAILLNLRFRLVLGLKVSGAVVVCLTPDPLVMSTYLAGLKFSFNESDSKLPNKHD